MNKYSNRIRVSVLIIGIIMFGLLAISTILKNELNNDYIGFQIFKSQLKANRLLIKNASFLPRSKRGKDLINMVQELDLQFYVLRDSHSLTIYRNLVEDYDKSMSIIEKQWDLFAESFFYKESLNSVVARTSIDKILIELESLTIELNNLEKRGRIFYIIILSFNLFAFILLLIVVSIFTENAGENSKGVMSVRNALIQGQEQERLRISLELHDKVAQDLFACRMTINEIYSATEEEGLISSAKKSLSLLDTSIKEVRDLSYSLRPPALQAIGVESAIQSYIDSFSSKIETPITFKALGLNNKDIDETVSINLYRILQETLNNTAKHAHAENIDVKLIYTYPFLLLKIEDDGVGFKYVKSEMKANGRNKLGLPGIKERVSLLGGELIINTEKGEGTKILIKVPIDGNEKM